jgi:2,5-dichloro-2,5-cyclohexadiene-1,4-diol dehydrogenase 1
LNDHCHSVILDPAQAGGPETRRRHRAGDVATFKNNPSDREVQMVPAYDRLNMAGRVIIVTGGGSGIGDATARLLASRGASVVVADVEEAAGRRTVEEILALGGVAAFVRTNVADEDDVRAMVGFAVAEFGGLHGAFNNAGRSSSSAPLTNLSLAAWRQVIDVNLTGVFLCMKHEIDYMLGHGGGAIANTSSGAGVVGFPHAIDYVASKHGVVGLTRAAAADYSNKGIRINAILPGGVDTPMLNSAMGNDPVVRQAVEQGHPIGRLAQPLELAEAAAWLLSDAASFVTGATFAVDGGYTAV